MFLLCFFGFVGLGLGSAINFRDIDIRDVPYHVTVERDNNSIADGALVAPDWVVVVGDSITWFNDDDWANHVQIRAGTNKRSEGGAVIKTKSHVFHPLFGENSYDYNVALIQLFIPLTLGEDIGVATLGTTAPTAGSEVIVTGFGSYVDEQASPNILQRFNVSIIARTACKIAYQDTLDDITERIVCAGMPQGKICYGESGQTVEQNGTLVALFATDSGCDAERTPALFTNLLHPDILSFIRRTISA